MDSYCCAAAAAEMEEKQKRVITDLSSCPPRRAVNVLEFFMGTPDIITNILFMNCTDLKNALQTAAKQTEAYKQLNLHMSVHNPLQVARDILVAYIILSADFDPANPTDMKYLWDVWFSAQWNESTRQRFVKDVKNLTRGEWNILPIVVPDQESVDQLKIIFQEWVKISQNLPAKILKEFHESRVYFSCLTYYSGPIPIDENTMVDGWVEPFGECMKAKSIEEFKLYHSTGNYEPLIGKTTCINLCNFLINMEEGKFEAGSIGICPYDAFFPVPFEEQITSSFDFKSCTALDYCKTRLQWLVTQLRSRKHRNTFHFHIGSCIDLCHRNESMWNKFHVIYTFDLADRYYGLANLIPAALNCLSIENPQSLLLTETAIWIKLENPTVSEFVEIALGCPLSLVPTLYGVRLINHLRLGSPDCSKLHDVLYTKPVTLQWLRAPAYSDNVLMGISPALKTAVERLAEMCFEVPKILSSSEIPSSIPDNLLEDFFELYSPETFYYVLRSLVERCTFVPGAAESLFLAAFPPSLQLTWRTLLMWLNGEPVQLYRTSKMKKAILELLNKMVTKMEFDFDSNSMPSFDLVLSLPPKKREPQHPKSNPVQIDVSNGHSVDFLCWDADMKLPKRVRFLYLSEPFFSFLLPADHGLEHGTRLFVQSYHDAKRKLITSSMYVNFKEFKPEVVINPSPSMMTPRLCPSTSDATPSIHILKCFESADSYELDVSLRGFTISSVNDLAVSTNQEHPSVSAHEITLTVANVEPLIFNVPWPVIADSINTKLLTKNKKKKLVHLVLTKSFHAPWPCEYGGRSKFDPDRLKHWQDFESNGNIKQHMMAQFDCRSLNLERRFLKNPAPSALNEVREIVRAIYYGFCYNSFSLFSVYDRQETNPVFQLRVRPPVLFTPKSAPLLLVSVIDHQLAQQLISRGKLDPEQCQSDLHRIITEGVSREVCTIRTSSAEEVQLLRFSLRLNSTKMRRGAWQSKNIPRGEDSPWMSTYVTPLYAENISDGCGKVDRVVQEISGGRCCCPPSDKMYLPSCASCHVKKVDLKFFTNCHVFTCSLLCHKERPSFLQSRCLSD